MQHTRLKEPYETVSQITCQLLRVESAVPVHGNLCKGACSAADDRFANRVKLHYLTAGNTGHWVLEERPKETTEALIKFL